MKNKNTQLLLDNKKLVKISKDLQKKQDEQKELINQIALQNNSQNQYIPNNDLNENMDSEYNDTILRKINPNQKILLKGRQKTSPYKNNNSEPLINEGYIYEPNYINPNGTNTYLDDKNNNNNNRSYDNYNYRESFNYSNPKDVNINSPQS